MIACHCLQRLVGWFVGWFGCLPPPCHRAWTEPTHAFAKWNDSSKTGRQPKMWIEKKNKLCKQKKLASKAISLRRKTLKFFFYFFLLFLNMDKVFPIQFTLASVTSLIALPPSGFAAAADALHLDLLVYIHHCYYVAGKRICSF